MHVKELMHKSIDELTFSVVDTETTGMHAHFCKVMDIGVVKVRGGKIIEKWETLVDPKQEVPYWITFFTKLSNKDVDGQPIFADVANKFVDVLGDSIFVAHNAEFDYAFLSSEMARLKKPFSYPKLCTVQLARKLLPELPAVNLDALSEFYKITVSQRHRALPDAEATAEVLLHFLALAKSRHHAKTFFDLHKLQSLHVPQFADQRQAESAAFLPL
jgi:DNA polymerase-3 subunit epsilon